MQPVTAQPTAHCYIHNNTHKKGEKKKRKSLPYGAPWDQIWSTEASWATLHCIRTCSRETAKKPFFSFCVCYILRLHATRAESPGWRTVQETQGEWPPVRRTAFVSALRKCFAVSHYLPPRHAVAFSPLTLPPRPPNPQNLKNYPAFHEAGDHTLLPCKRSNCTI